MAIHCGPSTDEHSFSVLCLEDIRESQDIKKGLVMKC